jgi:hypothetical protein
VHPKDIWKREGVKEIMDARHTVMGFSNAVEREIHRFVWTYYSFVVLWLLGKKIFLSLCL